MRKYSSYLLALFVLSTACGLDFGDDGDDARVGQFGMLRFTGGGGCNDSTTLAVGSTATLNLEAVHDQVLPGDLSPASTVPAVIAVSSGASTREIVLSAAQTGESEIEILSAGGVYDRLDFSAEPAFTASYTIAGDVYADGGLVVKIDEIYGSCGEDCPLIGGGFIEWSTEPDSALSLDVYDDRAALFIAGDPGQVRIIGREPTAGRILVDHTVDVLPSDGAGVLKSKVTVMLPDETVLDPDSFPDSLPAGSLLLLELQRIIEESHVVPLAGCDVNWSVVGESGVVEPWSETVDDQPLEGPIYETLSPGQVSLVAQVPLTGDVISYDLTVTE
jgi:hypothetical protein